MLLGNVPPKAELINFALKIIFVTYFSVGINIHHSSNSNYDRLDGITEWAFPLLLGGINELASWVMSASSSGLCKFSDVKYPADLSHIALWDALDCRLSHYLGLDVVATMLVENQARNHDFLNFDFFSFSVPPYFYLLIPAAISGNMTLVNLALMYPLLVISVAAYMINSTVICMIGIVILGVLAPLFVPMLLFEYTRGYFESWVKLMISFLLQPMVVTTFMITMFSVYDFGFYGTCKYTYREVNSALTQGGANAGLPGGLVGDLGGEGDNKRDKVRVFFVDNDWSKYAKSNEAGGTDEAKGCQKSLGYMLNNPLAAIYDFSKDNAAEMTKKEPGQSSTESFMSHFDFLRAIAFGPSMLFISPNVVFEKIKDVVLALTTACFTLYLMYNFSSQLSEFAADMTEGVSLSSVTINPQTLFKAGMQALAMANNLKGGMGGDKMSAGGAARTGDKMEAGGGDVATEDQAVVGGGDGNDESEDQEVVGNRHTETRISTRSSTGSQAARPSSDGIDSISIDSEWRLGTTQDNAPSEPFVPMEKLSTNAVKENLEDFFSKKNINHGNLEGFDINKFAKYAALASDKENFVEVKDAYEEMLHALKNDNMSGVQKELRQKLESMYSGTQKKEITKIHDRVFAASSAAASSAESPTGQQNREGAIKPNTEQGATPSLSITDDKPKKPKDDRGNE